MSFLRGRFLVMRYRLTSRRLLGTLAVLVTAAAVIVYPTLATDFDGDHSGQTLTAPDNVFRFLAGFIGTNITVQASVAETTLNFSNAPVAVTVDLSNTSLQTVYAGLTITFNLNTSNGIYLYGSSGNDTLTGSSGADAIAGQSGNDTINGGGGNDTLQGGVGDDTLNGGAGTSDYFSDTSGNAMTVDLGAGTATGNGTDTLVSIENVVTGSGNDTLIGDGNDNIFNAGGGDDTITGGGGMDTFVDTSHNAMTVNLGTGTATGNGTDTFTSIENIGTGNGNDTLIGDGNDNRFNAGGGDDTITGGGGGDMFVDQSGNNMNVNLVTGTATGNGTDTFTSIENILTGNGDDTLIGDGNDNLLSASAGSDTIVAGAGNDTIYGGAGSDTIVAGAGNDFIYGGAGGDSVDGGAGTDMFDYIGVTHCVGDTVTNVETNTCPVVVPPAPSQPAAALTPELCLTRGTRIAVEGGKLLIFSDFGPHNPNGMTITHMALGSLRNPTDDEKMSGLAVLLAYKDSEFAPGWSAAVYWKDSHYGVVVYKEGGKTIFEDTGAICGWF